MNKFLTAAAALLVSTGASAQSSNARHTGASVRHAVLDNIIDRVQMDALIDSVADVEVAPAPVRAASASFAANVAGDTARSARVRRNDVNALMVLPTRG